MGTTTTMGELAALWQEMTAEERRNYRVRFGDDVFEVISIDAKDDQATVRGYQLNGPMATTQRDDNSRAARVKLFPLNLGGVEILDHDEPVDDDDPGPPPVLRLAESGEYERLDHEAPPNPDPLPPVINPGPADRPWKVADIEVLGSDLDPLPPGTYTKGGVTVVVEPPGPSVLDTPVDSWASTAIRMPHELLDRLSKEAKRRGIGRNILLAHLADQALNAVEGRPLV